MRCTLKPQQTEAVDKALAAYAAGHRGFLCGFKMGLGKTIIALSVAERLPKKYNLIAIVCPAFIAPKWRREIEDKAEHRRGYKFAIYTYSELTDDAALRNATNHRFDLIIFDEVHYGKSYTSQRTEATLGKAGLHIAADRLLGLSGTWPPNNISDCFTWFKASENPLAENGFEPFCREHAEFCERNKFGLQVRGFKDSPKFRELFDPVFIGRDTFAEPGEIPEPLRLSEIVTPSKALEKAELEIFGDFFDDAELIEKALETMPSFDRIAEFRKRQGMAKIAPVVEYSLEARDEFARQIIFCYHQEVAQQIAKKLTARKVTVELITGTNTTPEDRDEIMQRANKADEVIIVATIDALREGIDANGFDIMIFAESDWRAWALEQAEGRLRHELWPRQVRYVYFTFPRGVDKAMVRTMG
jgi:superfamily II DNA or RNA helicase